MIRLVDAAVQKRVDNVLAFTDKEHYRVFRGKDETQPAAEMTALDSYTKGVGKTYSILAVSGSTLVQKFGLRPLIANETEVNKPENVEHSWFTSANYEMHLHQSGLVQMNGRSCYVLAITPRHKAPNMIHGMLWVDSKDGSIVQVQGVASKSPSPFAGTTHMMRQYTNIDGYAMATNARAESSSILFGTTVVLIEYTDYHLRLRNAR